MATHVYLDDNNDGALEEEKPTNRHLFRRALITLFLGVILIGGFTLWNPDVLLALGGHRPITMLENSGVVLLNASELNDHISLPMHGDHRAYWIGPIADSSYTINCVTPGRLTVDYFKANQTLANQTFTDGILPFIRVTAYESKAFYDSKLRPLTSASTTIMANSQGDTLEINTTSLTRIVIMPRSSQEVITINYSTPQSIASMVHDSENLVKV